MNEFSFFSPETLDEVCQLLASTEGMLISGGTDVIPQMRDGRLNNEKLNRSQPLEGPQLCK